MILGFIANTKDLNDDYFKICQNIKTKVLGKEVFVLTFADLFLIGNAFLLGLRHGIDWDHIAAILDIVGSANTVKSQHQFIPIKISQNSLILSLAYAIGHGLIVIVFGIAAICFSANLPSWLDPIMERIVGITLLILGFWVFYSLFCYMQSGQNFQLKSRWMLIFNIIEQTITSLRTRINKQTLPKKSVIKQYGLSTAFTVGAIHGIGAETGTQVLLLTAISTISPVVGVIILSFFVFGIIISNTLVAMLGSAGIISATNIKPAYVTLGVFTGIFSLTIGSFFTFGYGTMLPDLQKMLGT
jgi:high-affinity nickel-transport protein